MSRGRTARRLRPAALLTLLAGFAAPFSPVFALDPHPSVSASKQMIVYCDDPHARSRVASFADEVKAGVLAALGAQDRWKFPIVITIEPAKTASPQPGSELRLYEIEGGFKIGVRVVLGDDMSAVRFQQDLTRAVLLELAYRAAPTIKGGKAYTDPPKWLVEAIVDATRNSGPAANPDVFKTLVAQGKVPALRDFLAENPDQFDSASRALYEAEALSLLQLLAELPNGRTCLLGYVRGFPNADPSDPAGSLTSHFPALAGSEQALGKWWALMFARFAASDRFYGLSAEETEKRLAPLLAIDVPEKNGKGAQRFTLEQFAEYLKNPASHEILKNRLAELAALSSTAHFLFAPIIREYTQILSQIEHGKTKEVPRRLADAAKFRQTTLARLDQINDYMNWLEATQMPSESGAFKAPEKAPPVESKRPDGISRYLDATEHEFEDQL